MHASRASPSSARTSSMSGEILTKAWLPMLPKEPCKILVVNPFPTAFVLTLRGDGVKRALDAAKYPYADLAATGDQGQNLGLIGAALQADPSICGVAALGGPAANPAGQYISDEQSEGFGRNFRCGSRDREAHQGRLHRYRHQPAAIPAELLCRGKPGPAVAVYAEPGKRGYRHLAGDQGKHRQPCRPALPRVAAECRARL